MSYLHSPRLSNEGKETYFKTCLPLNINRCLFTGGTKWPSLPPVGQTGHHQRATRVSSSCVKTGQFVSCVSVTTLWPCVVCVCVCVSGFRRTRRGQRRATATCWSFSGITCFTRWQKLGRPGSTSATSSPASTKSVSFLLYFPFIDLFDEHTGTELSSVMQSSMQSGIFSEHLFMLHFHWLKKHAYTCQLIAEERE